MLTTTNAQTLSEVLSALGWTHKKHTTSRLIGRDVFKPDGEHVGVLSAGECWEFLRELGLIARTDD
jgi:hypothetical protein